MSGQGNRERQTQPSSLVAHCSVEPGLCGTCRMARRITTARGSTFYYCTRAEADPAYGKYPRLPVLHCAGHLPAGD